MKSASQVAAKLLAQAAWSQAASHKLATAGCSLLHSLQSQRGYAHPGSHAHPSPAGRWLVDGWPALSDHQYGTAVAHSGHDDEHAHDDAHHHEPVPYGYHGSPGVVEYSVAYSQTSESGRIARTLLASTAGCVAGGALGTAMVGSATGMVLACAGSLAVSGLWGKSLPGRYYEFWIDPRMQWAMAAFGPLGVTMFGIYGVPAAVGGALGGCAVGAIIGALSEKDTDIWFPEYERAQQRP